MDDFARLLRGGRLACGFLRREHVASHSLANRRSRSGPRRTPALAAGARCKKGRYPLQIFVRDNNIDQALRVLKKKMQREGIFREMKQRRSYEKPSERKNREKSEAIRRARKLARKKAQREGLIPDPRKKKLLDGGARGTGLGQTNVAVIPKHQ